MVVSRVGFLSTVVKGVLYAGFQRVTISVLLGKGHNF